MRNVRPRVSSALLCTLVAFYLLAFTNLSFWRKMGGHFADHPSTLIAGAAAIFLAHVAILLIFSWRYLVKPVCMFLILAAAAGSYFSDTYGTIIDRNLIDSSLTTTRVESSALITTQLIFHMIAYGLVPCILVAWVRLHNGSFLRGFAVNAFAFVACLTGALTLVGWNYGSLSSRYREYKPHLMGRMMPSAVVGSAVMYAAHRLEDHRIVMQPLGLDARQTLSAPPFGKPLLTVIVIGETARAANFGLFGYDRDTNPELRKRDIVAFPHTTSCGTDTGVSVPCMFSPFTQNEYSRAKFLSSENLMDVLKHAKIEVAWFNNNGGSKHVADRIKYVDLPDDDERFCDGKSCRDELLVEALREHVGSIHGNAVVVLHTMGSHGPDYYRRYPAEFARFQPDCRSNHFPDCTTEEIVNAYDNSVLYTDHVLSEIIGLLQDNAGRFATSMVYMSDHGESLGEGGLYLHATPYFIAPTEQTHIPFIAWFSPEFSMATGLDAACVRLGATEPASHDNLFHTVLGMMAVRTTAYDPALDRFAACRARLMNG